jgi:bifunctional UDP-N-acetylglucosamine pyrophosphorylase/glucosamine-1-phosphate N-acetyltransferase
MTYRWWNDLNNKLEEKCMTDMHRKVHDNVIVGEGTFISDDAKLNGNIVIGCNCMIGTGVIIRGNVIINDNVRIGYGTEVKNSIIKENTTIGPLCYLGDSMVEQNVYLGAMVRTSNHRLDRANIKSWNGMEYEDTNLEKLGAWIKEKSSLGVGVVILPGRIVPDNSIFGPHIVITKNYPSGIYKMAQNIIKVEHGE